RYSSVKRRRIRCGRVKGDHQNNQRSKRLERTTHTMPNVESSQAVDLLVNQLAPDARVTVLTGAGVSAASGVPTFRGADGLWKQHRAEDLATPEAFARDP